MKRFAIFVTAVALLLSTCISEAYAVTSDSGTSVPKKVSFYLKPDISVELNGERQIFRDANNQMVHPIIYNGTTYLPVRAVSALMKEPVEWDDGSKTVYIGKTLKYPIKSSAPIPTEAAAPATKSDLSVLYGMVPCTVTGYLKPDVFVMYDFEMQTFYDAKGLIVYPLNYNGSIYLPVRAVSGLMDEPITWDDTEKKICIGDGEEEEEPIEAESEEEEPEEEISENFKLFKEYYESEEALYYESSAKISKVKDADSEKRQAIAVAASENYLKAQSITMKVKTIDQSSFSEEEKAAYNKLLAFAESNEYYLLVLENIAYLASAESDYSMLAETFLYFALEAQTNMAEARALIIIDE